MGKSVARGSKKSLIRHCFNDPIARSHMLNKIGQVLRHEIKVMCSDNVNSILKSPNTDELKVFTWDKVLSELKLHAPVLTNILFSCTKTKAVRENQTGTVGFIASMLLRYKYNRMNLVQKIISLILYAGHCAKQVNMKVSTGDKSKSFLLYRCIQDC